jgi:REP element-mobilizing transposase RayT
MRVQYPGAMYHVMSRGGQRDDIFFDDGDRYDFIRTLGEACLKTDWLVQAFCLMKNHYHLAVETPNANLVVNVEMNEKRKNTGLTPLLIRNCFLTPARLLYAARVNARCRCRPCAAAA